MLSCSIEDSMLLVSSLLCMTKVRRLFKASCAQGACVSSSPASEIFLESSCQRKRLLHNLEPIGKCFFLADWNLSDRSLLKWLIMFLPHLFSLTCTTSQSMTAENRVELFLFMCLVFNKLLDWWFHWFCHLDT